MPLLEVGHVVKPHGLRGEVLVRFISNRPERLVAGTRLQTEEGAGEELEIASIRSQGDRHLVVFSGVEGIEAAERLRGVVLFAEPIEDADALFVHDLIGSEVFDVAGEALGTVTGVEANPASDLLVVDGRTYVPAVFVVSSSPGRIVVDPPKGLFE